MVGSGLYGSYGIVRAGVSEKTVVWMRDRTRIALADRGMSAVSHPERIPLRRFLSVRTREEARPSVGHVSPAGLFRPDSSARTFSPDVPLRTFPSYSLGGRFVSGSRGALRFRRRILAAAFPFVRFFSYIRLKDNRPYC